MPTKKEVIDHLVEVAKGEIGVREHPKGSNRGAKVDRYQSADSLAGVGYAWCGSFNAWCIRATEDDLKVDIPYNYSASCDQILSWARSNGVIYETPEVGDVMLVMNLRNRRDSIHTGIVVKVTGNSFQSIEGNTNNDGGREGYGVIKHTRQNGDRYLFARPADLMKFKDEPKKRFTLIIGTRSLPVFLIGNAGYVGVRDWGEALGFDVSWNANLQCPVYEGRDAAVECKKIGTLTVGPLRKLAELAGLDLVFNAAGDEISLRRLVPLEE